MTLIKMVLLPTLATIFGIIWVITDDDILHYGSLFLTLICLGATFFV